MKENEGHQVAPYNFGQRSALTYAHEGAVPQDNHEMKRRTLPLLCLILAGCTPNQQSVDDETGEELVKTTIAEKPSVLGMVIVDTSVWIDLLQARKSGTVAKLERLLAEEVDAFATGLIVQEVLSGIKNRKER